MTEKQPHPEQGYIILEHELRDIERYPFDPVTRVNIFKVVRSHPHSDAKSAEAVLEELEKYCTMGMKTAKEQQHTPTIEMYRTEMVGQELAFRDMLQKIKELRQQEKRE